MQHRFYSANNLEVIEVFVSDIDIKEIEHGKYKGQLYFAPSCFKSRRAVSIPHDFAYNGFLDIDPNNIDELYKIQTEYGFIASPKFQASNGETGNASYMLMNKEYELSDNLNKYLRSNRKESVRISPYEEVRDTVAYLQELIRATIAVNNDDFTLQDRLLDETFNDLGSKTYTKYFKIFGIANDDETIDSFIANTLIDAVILQQMKFLATDGRKVHRCGYRKCGKYFKYPKRERSKPPYYCCQSHQEAEKSCRQNDNKRLEKVE